MGWVDAEFWGEGRLGFEDDVIEGWWAGGLVCWWAGGLVCSRLLLSGSFSKMAAPSLVLFNETIYFGESGALVA